MISLDDIRVRGRRSLRLIRTALASLLALRSSRGRNCTLCRLDILLLLSRKASHATTLLTWELASVGLTSNSAVAWLSMSSRLFMCDDVVGGTTVCALAVGNLLVLIVRVGVLEDDVPGVQETRKEAKAAESKVDERVGATNAFLHPYYTCCQRSVDLYMIAHKMRVPGLAPCCRGGYVPPMGGKRTLSSIKKQSVPHILTIVSRSGFFGVLGERLKVDVARCGGAFGAA
jgi:hypothetical protein